MLRKYENFRFSLHDVIFVADFSSHNVIVADFLGFQFARFCCGRFSLHVILSRIFQFARRYLCCGFQFARRYFCRGFILSWTFRCFCRGFFGHFSLHNVFFVADFSDVSVCTTLFCHGRFSLHDVFCRGFFGRFSLHDVVFIADFSLHDVIFVAVWGTSCRGTDRGASDVV